MSTNDFATGVWAATLTPVDSEFSIDTSRMLTHVNWLLDSGCHGIGLFGTTGEAVSFSVAERTRTLDALLAGGVKPAQLMPGAGCCALSDSIALAQHAVENGVFDVLMLPPFYYKGMSDEGLARSFGEVIERVGDARLNVYLYNFPRLSGVPITKGLLDILTTRYPGVVAGVKDSSGDFENMKMMFSNFPDLSIFPGSERFLLDGLRLGGAGCITATANANPRGIRDVWDAFQAGDETVDAIQARTTEVRSVVEKYALVTGQKALMAQHRSDDAWLAVRPPMTPFEPDEISTMLKDLESIGFSVSG